MNNLQDSLKDLYNNSSDNVIGISIGFKYINNEKTDTIAVVYFVKNKLPIDQIQPPEQLIPSSLNIDGTTYATDVIEMDQPVAVSCYSSSDADVTRLQTETFPLRGGQEIIRFPNGFSTDGSSYTMSTLGMMCVDNIDNKFVGLGCAHSILNKFDLARDADLNSQITQPYNIYDNNNVFNTNNYRPSAVCWNKTSPVSTVPNKNIGNYIKRYVPLLGGTTTPSFSINSIPEWNQVDVAVLGIKSIYLDINSHKIYTPIGDNEYSQIMDFATTNELDNLLNTNPLIYSTGRTSGPKGYSNTCRMSITNINQYIVININGTYYPFNNAITFRYNNTSFSSPVQTGDSGSAVIAEYGGGVRKILGIIFAKSSVAGFFCRIDNIVSQLNIRKWDWTNSIDPTVLTSRLSESTPSLLKIETTAGAYNTVKSQNTIAVGGKTYYQSGFTKNNYTLYTG
jgi:hypothetical protein